MDEFYDIGYTKRRRTIAKLKRYYSRKTVQKAVENGLVALVADGIHKLPPEELGKDGQLYTIHGVCNNGIDVPLIHVLMKRKNQSAYDKVFRMAKEEAFRGHLEQWGKAELRTSNIAESYHRVLRVFTRENWASVRNTIMALKGNDRGAMCKLRNMERRIIRRLRKKDLKRCQRIKNTWNFIAQNLSTMLIYASSS
ncbi:unnamed protein product [Cylicocyclus nassatus]|uniref:Uncharacterized protein n=1 Tax=Cylicocyclus nassatus TaxID=53992 RepID=A0AA36H176_CYLNA|nr:unnamed protein product [Cylicocyclus nassatus]